MFEATVDCWDDDVALDMFEATVACWDDDVALANYKKPKEKRKKTYI